MIEYKVTISAPPRKQYPNKKCKFTKKKDFKKVPVCKNKTKCFKLKKRIKIHTNTNSDH